MRVISGEAGSLPLRVPRSLTRPTTDRVREAMFSSLGERVLDATVLDLFAGSGSLGIEALSRGARSAVFVDANHDASEIIRKNLSSTKLDSGTVRQQKVSAFLATASPASFSLVFADPPYAKSPEQLDELHEFLSLDDLARCLSPDGILVLETFSGQPLPDQTPWNALREKNYGNTRVSYLSLS